MEEVRVHVRTYERFDGAAGFALAAFAARCIRNAVLNHIRNSPQDSLALRTIIQADRLDALPYLAGGSADLSAFSPPRDAIRDYQGGWLLDYCALG